MSVSRESTRARARHSRRHSRRRAFLRLVLVAALAATAGAVAWVFLRDTSDSSPSGDRAGGSGGAGVIAAEAASATSLRKLSASVRHPIFWLGPKSGDTYELTKTSNGKIYIRYLPAGVSPGANAPYLTVATYPFPGAYAAITRGAAARGAVKVDLAHGGVAVLDRAYPESVHLAYPDVDYQVEIYDPTPRRALRLVSSGKVDFFGKLTTSVTGASEPEALSASELKSFTHAVKHPIYWSGPRHGYRYEVTRTANGDVYVRYLPSGVKVGAAKPYLTIVTYPFPHALATLREAVYTSGSGVSVFRLTGGGLAVVDNKYPKNVNLAFPKSNYQVEIFDPRPQVAQRIATSGSVAPVG
jgi:hypothetical protein